MLLSSSWPNGHLMTPLEYACHGVTRGTLVVFHNSPLFAAQ